MEDQGQQQGPRLMKLLARRPSVAEHPDWEADGSNGRSFAAVLSDARMGPERHQDIRNVYNIVMASQADPAKCKRVKAKNLQCFHLLGDDLGTVVYMTMDPPISTQAAKLTLKSIFEGF